MSSFFIISTKFYAKLVRALTGINLFYLVYVVGLFYSRLPPVTSPKTEYLTEVITDAFVAVIVCYSVNLSLAKVFAKRRGYVIYSNQVDTEYTHTPTDLC